MGVEMTVEEATQYRDAFFSKNFYKENYNV